MLNVIKASLYKLFKDRPFKVTMIVGACLAVLFSVVYVYGIPEMGYTGYQMLLTSSSPTNNFGLAVPINLVVFIIGEYNYGTIRNKIIAGNKRINIYLSLFITGIIFSLILMAVYILISTGLVTLFSGKFFPDGSSIEIGELFATIGYTVIIYITITALSLFSATAFRHVGGSITLTVLTIVAGLIISLVVFMTGVTNGLTFDSFEPVVYIFNPIFVPTVVNQLNNFSASISGLVRAIGLSVISNVIYTAIFLGAGLAIFNFRDVK